MDKLSPRHRSWNMAQIKSKNTKPEVIMFKLLRDFGYKFRKHYDVYGKPDIAFPKLKVAIFIDGEFWHGKDFEKWKEKLSPFWLNKIQGNIVRDKKNLKLLRKDGWHTLRLWGKDINRNPQKSVTKIIRFVEKYLQK